MGRRTDVVRLVEDDDGILAHLLRDLLGDFRVEEVVEGVDDDADLSELRVWRGKTRSERHSGSYVPSVGQQSTDRRRAGSRTP